MLKYYHPLLILSIAFFISIESKNIFVFGDSHASFCFRVGPTLLDQEFFDFPYSYHGKSTKFSFKLFPFVSVTMHRVGRDGLRFIDCRKHGVSNNDVMVFTFGEVDVRCHIGKQRDLLKRDLSEVIETLLTNYFSTITANRDLYNDITCVVMSVVPPSEILAEQPLHMTVYGTLADRVHVNTQLNKRIKQLCKIHNILFLDITDLYAASDGRLNPELSDGGVHINYLKNFPIKERLFSILSI